MEPIPARALRASVYASILIGLTIVTDASVGDFGVWGRETRSLAAVAVGAGVGTATMALCYLALTAIVFVFLPFRRDPIQIVGAWGMGLGFGAVVLIAIALAAVAALGLFYPSARQLPDAALYVVGKAAAWLGLLAMYMIGLMPSSAPAAEPKLSVMANLPTAPAVNEPPRRAPPSVRPHPSGWLNKNKRMFVWGAAGAIAALIAGYMTETLGEGSYTDSLGEWLLETRYLSEYSPVWWALAGAALGALARQIRRREY